MQRCPNCGTVLPNNAGFCAHCGFSLKSAADKASRTKSASRTSARIGDVKVKEPPVLPATKKTPLPVEPESGEIKEQPLLATIEETPRPVEPESGKMKNMPALPVIEETPRPIEPESGKIAPVPTLPVVEETPRPAELEDIEVKETMALSAIEKTPPPVKPEDIEVKETIALPAMKKTPRPAEAEDIEVKETMALSAIEKTPPGGERDIDSLNTIAMPVVPQTPGPVQNKGRGKRPAPSSVEMQKTLPVAAVEKKAPQKGLSDQYPRVDVYSDGTFVMYRGSSSTGGKSQSTIRRSNPPAKGDPDTMATLLLPSAPGGKTKGPIRRAWRVISAILARAQDPEPERLKRPEAHTNPVGWLPVLALTSALGLFTVVTAYNAARDNTPGAELYFWLGIGLIFLPATVRFLFAGASRLERVGLLCSVAICLYLVKVTLSPIYFIQYDEFLHWSTVNDIVATGHLFAQNSLLPVSPFYPGLEIVTAALSNLSGLSTFQSGLVVVGMACLLMVLSLYLLSEQLTGSARIASIATIIYMTNPHFLLFDSQFAYESLALPLATFVLFAMTRYELLNNNRRWVLLAAWLALAAMIVTHHLTNFIFEGLFLLWAVIYLFLRPLPLRKSIVIPTVIFGLILTVITVTIIGNTVISYFTSFFGDVGGEIAQALTSSGASGSRQLFSNTAAQPTPLWERLISLAAVGLITASIPFYLLCFWRRYRRNALLWLFCIMAMLYPVTQVLRLTDTGAEAADRASSFIFIAISLLSAIAIAQFFPVRFLKWKQPVLICCAIFVLFMGGIILGNGIPTSFMPGPYQVVADARSIEPEGIQAAIWAHTYLGPDNRVATDRDNQLLMSAYGDQYIVSSIAGDPDITDVFFSPVVDTYEISLLKAAHVHYLVIDMRLSKGLPQIGYYFEPGEPGAYTRTKPIDAQFLTKFDTVPQINRVFDSGDIVIYDTGGLINAPAQP